MMGSNSRDEEESHHNSDNGDEEGGDKVDEAEVNTRETQEVGSPGSV
jgi:hypothetical protein